MNDNGLYIIIVPFRTIHPIVPQVQNDLFCSVGSNGTDFEEK